MTRFDSMMKKYRSEILDEEEMAPAAAAPDPAAAPPPPPEGDPAAEEPEISPEEVIDELEKASKKPWTDLAGVLSRAMEFKWSDDDVTGINNSLPGGLTLRDFINIRNSPNIKDKYDSNIVSASIMLFDYVDKRMSENNMEEVVPAEER